MRHINLHLTKTRIAGAIFALVLLLQGAVPLLMPSASAAGTLTNTLVRFDRLSTSTPTPIFTSGTVCAKETSTGTDAVASVTFPTGFTVSGTVGNWTVSTATTTGWPTGAIAWPSIAAPTGSGNFTIVGQTVNFQSGDLNTTNLYCFNWTNNTAALETPTTTGAFTGSVTTQTNAPAAIDTGNYATTIVGANADQIVVTATVNPTFSMALSANSDALGNLTTGSVSPSPTPRTATVNTNATNGWYLWGKDSNAGLNSATAGYTIASNCSAGVGTLATLGAGAEGYNLGAVATSQTGGTGTVSIGGVFNSLGTSFRGGGLCSTNYQTVASSTGTANTSVVTLTNNAAISGITKPGGDYTDTETFVGAGLF